MGASWGFAVFWIEAIVSRELEPDLLLSWSFLQDHGLQFHTDYVNNKKYIVLEKLGVQIPIESSPLATAPEKIRQIRDFFTWWSRATGERGRQGVKSGGEHSVAHEVSRGPGNPRDFSRTSPMPVPILVAKKMSKNSRRVGAGRSGATQPSLGGRGGRQNSRL